MSVNAAAVRPASVDASWRAPVAVAADATVPARIAWVGGAVEFLRGSGRACHRQRRARAPAGHRCVMRLQAPLLDGEDHTKDIDFTPAGVRARWQSGYADALRMIDREPWTEPVDAMEGVVVHQGV